VIGDSEVLHAPRLCGGGHFGQCGRAVTIIGVAMKCASEIGPVDQRGKPTRFGGLKLPGVFAQLGRDKSKPKCREQSTLVDAGNRSIGPRQSVLVERESACQRPSAHGDIVSLRTGEIVKREGKLGVIDSAQIALHSVRQPDTRLGWTMGQDGCHLG
jgi:hypothetical protein